MRKKTINIFIHIFCLSLVVGYLYCVFFSELFGENKTLLFGTADSRLVFYFTEELYRNIIQLRPVFYGSLFFPYENTLSFSHLLLPYQIFYLPLRLFLANSILAYNLTVFLFFTISLIVVYIVAYKETKNIFLCLAFVFFISSNLIFTNYILMHPQLLVAILSFPCFIFFKKFLKLKMNKDLVLFLLFSFLIFVSDPSVFSMLVVFLIYISVFEWREIYSLRKLPGKKILSIILFCFLFLMGTGYFAYIYWQTSLLSDAFRSLTEIQTYSTRFVSLSLIPSFSKTYTPSDLQWGWHESVHFMGFSLIFLFSVVLIFSNALNRKRFLLALLPIIISYLVSFGPDFIFKKEILTVNPFYHLSSFFNPGLLSTRSLGRLVLLIFPAFLYINLFYLFKIKFSKTGLKSFLVCLVICFLSESGFAYQPSSIDFRQIGLYNELKEILNSNQSVVKIPLEVSAPERSYVVEWMIATSAMNLRTVEGYSGFSPRIKDRYARLSEAFMSGSERPSVWSELISFAKKDKLNVIIIEKSTDMKFFFDLHREYRIKETDHFYIFEI